MRSRDAQPELLIRLPAKNDVCFLKLYLRNMKPWVAGSVWQLVKYICGYNTFPAEQCIHHEQTSARQITVIEMDGRRSVARQKHFLVCEVILPEAIGAQIEWVEIEAVYTKARQRINWKELRDETRWRQGWV